MEMSRVLVYFGYRLCSGSLWRSEISLIAPLNQLTYKCGRALVSWSITKLLPALLTLCKVGFRFNVMKVYTLKYAHLETTFLHLRFFIWILENLKIQFHNQVDVFAFFQSSWCIWQFIYELNTWLVGVIWMGNYLQRHQTSVIGINNEEHWLGLIEKAWMDQPLLIKKSLMMLGIWFVWLAPYSRNDCCEEKKRNVISHSPGLLFLFGLISYWAKVLPAPV